jgi:hypothetical protein
MKVIIDTSSLLSLVRYYLPFDKDNILYKYIEKKIVSGEIIILDKVFNECYYVAKGLVLKKMNYLENKKLHFNTTDLLPDSKFFNLLENQFCNDSSKNKLSPPPNLKMEKTNF